MNCQRFENVVSELARGQMMAAEQRGEALAHSDACEECAARLRDEQMLTRGLKSLAVQMEALSAPVSVETQLLEAFRARSVATPVYSRPSRSRYWLAAVAAVLLIAMSAIAVWWRSDNVKRSRDVITETVPQSEPKIVDTPSPELPKEVEYQTVDQTPKRRRPVRNPIPRRPANLQPANHVNSEIATDFIPLRYMSASSFQDGGQIVRVELPRSALVNFGLPVNMERYNEKVKADVLLGVDGMAHAIRFVQ